MWSCSRTSWGVFAIIICGVVVNAWYRPFLGLLLQGGHPGSHTFLITLLVVSNVILNAVLIPLLGIQGAATATALMLVLEGLFLTFMARRLLQVRL